MLKRVRLAITCCLLGVISLTANARQIITIKPQSGDMTPVVRKVLEGVSDKEVKIVLSKGTYFFRPDYAMQKFCYITNHGNGLKNIIFPFINLNSVEIEGNGASLIFHGQVMPFLFQECKNVSVADVRIDWDIPFFFQGAVIAVNEKEGWRDIKPSVKGFSWRLANGKLQFPDVDGFNYSELGSTLPFDAQLKRVVDSGFDTYSNPRWVEKRSDGILRFHEPMRHYPPVGSILTSKGDREHDRYAPAFQVISSKDISLQNVTVHHALGMGFLFERSENISLKDCNIVLPEGSERMISTTADATHFANCKGDVLIESCRFENMLDDGTNVHGTYVQVDKILDDHTLQYELKHFEQLGFEFAGAGDEVWFVHSPHPQRASVNEVVSVSPVNDRFAIIRFKNKLSANLTVGDLIENKTWNPVFTMRGCTIRNHRARNVVLKTPLKTIIENNFFSSMMSAILFRGESFFWYESGQVEDATIRNNRFEHCAYSGEEHAVLYITPRLGKTFDKTIPYDRNIRFINNIIETFGNRIVWADRAEGLVISGNTIKQTNDGKPVHPQAALFDFANCRDVQLTKNVYTGNHAKFIQADSASQQTLQSKNNKGF